MITLYYVWVSLLTNGFIDALVAGLIRQGLSVGPLGAKGDMVTGGATPVVALKIEIDSRIEKTKEVVSASIVNDVVRAQLSKLGAKFNLVLVHGKASGDFSWFGSNFEIPVEKPPTSRFERVGSDES